mmetsp:Transcript_48641/g.121453  ORF Transcript_48641/g.121453 Transcript_48641/m.121453 type:complete len:80 (-) Transcript_48641:3075-3314(-)
MRQANNILRDGLAQGGPVPLGRSCNTVFYMTVLWLLASFPDDFVLASPFDFEVFEDFFDPNPSKTFLSSDFPPPTCAGS